ncbi:MAG: Fur family transcriptional regulator [Anaerolineales bacterium]|jgi:Fur family ferric uptake transcriptional regulator
MELRETLNQEGLRLTRPRRIIMSILEQAAIPLSPQTIQLRAIQTHQDISLVSVYRTIDLLTNLELVRRVHGHDGCQGYALSSPGHHHHLVCRDCGKTIEFCGSEDLSNLVDTIQEQSGFQIDGHLLQLFGRCPECQKDREDERHG